MSTIERIVGGDVVMPDGLARAHDLVVADGRIVSIEPTRAGADPDAVVALDATGCLVAPGLIDLQINGGWGHDFTSDASSIAAVAARLPSTGVTGFLPTVVSSSRLARDNARATWRALVADSSSAHALGLHFEGPMISSDRAGAHDRAHIGRPDDDELMGWSPDDGVMVVTLAPEVEGALDVAAGLSGRGVVVSMGHTACSADQVTAARAAGVSAVTHLFNAMAPFTHRLPGPVGAVLADDGLVAGVICDGIHVDPVAVRMAWRALGRQRLLLITDAMAALGIDAETAMLGSIEVTIGGNGVRTGEGVLAGSNLTMDQAVRNLVAFTGCSADEALRAASETPARLLGLTDRGRIEVGHRADVTVFDRDLRLRHTIIGGVVAWRS